MLNRSTHSSVATLTASRFDSTQPSRYFKQPGCCVSSPPCLPTKSATPPSGPFWLHEIKHDGFRVIACKRTGADL